MFFDTIDDLKKSDEIYTEFLNDYIHMGEDLMADFVVLISILRRAVDLNNAFITLTDSGNYIAAAPLLRLQLDNMLYCYARTIAANDNDFLVGFMDGSNWKVVSEGEFGNLRANPVEQQISFPAQKARYVRFFSTAALDGSGSSVAELKLLSPR